MQIEEARNKVAELRGRFEKPFSSADKETIGNLYWEVLRKTLRPTNCQQCYHDALIEIYLYLKNNSKMKQKTNYRMRAGYIINSPKFDNGKVYSNDNLTDEVAERYLAQFPKSVSMFEALPKGFSIEKITKKVKALAKKEENPKKEDNPEKEANSKKEEKGLNEEGKAEGGENSEGEDNSKEEEGKAEDTGEGEEAGK